jgi:hypothetical protein
MHRGIEIGIHLKPGLRNDNFVAEALGNLAAYRLQEERGEALEWQVLRVEESHRHHYRLIVRHPSRVLDLGLAHALKNALDTFSNESVEELSQRFHEAKAHGLKPVALRHVHESLDLWHDDFWKHLG